MTFVKGGGILRGKELQACEHARSWKPCYGKRYDQFVDPCSCKPYENCADDT